MQRAAEPFSRHTALIFQLGDEKDRRILWQAGKVVQGLSHRMFLTAVKTRAVSGLSGVHGKSFHRYDDAPNKEMTGQHGKRQTEQG